MLSIGLTGARGVLGSRICEAAERKGHVVWPFPGDVRDKPAVRAWLSEHAPSCVIHAAAIVPVKSVNADVQAAISVNVGGSAAVAESCRQAGVRLVYISTSHVYSPSASQLTEDHPLAPATLYGLTKLQGEQWCSALVGGALLARVFSYFDARQADSFLVPGLVGRIASCPPGGAVQVFGANNVRDIADAGWLADTIVELLNRDATGAINCGTGRGLTVGEIAEATLSASGRSDVTLDMITDQAPNRLVAETKLLGSTLSEMAEFNLASALGALYRA